MPIAVKCEICGTEKSVLPYRANTFRFCSKACQGISKKTEMALERHPFWQGGDRVKTCEHCRKVFEWIRGTTYASFRVQRFCCKPCADKGGFRYSGPDHYNWTGNARRTHRGPHAAWARAVISRDKATCQVCGVTGVELHAHHVKPYKDHPELRDDLENGLTVCYACHWSIHSTGAAENGVNSGNTAAGHAGGNPEPSFERKFVEGVTTKGRAYKRWEGNCDNCGAFLSKRPSDVAGKPYHYCSHACAMQHRWRIGILKHYSWR